jgi:hypothetical protein
MTVFGDHVVELQDGGRRSTRPTSRTAAARATREKQTPDGQGAWLSNEMPKM